MSLTGEGVFMAEDQPIAKKVFKFGTRAIGKINPNKRAEAGEISLDKVDSLIGRIGNFYEKTIGRLPKWCIDGRFTKEREPLYPDAAGGTYSLVFGEALIYADNLIERGLDSSEHGAEIFQQLLHKGHSPDELGGHRADHVEGDENCGCGACDAMPVIMQYLAENSDAVKELANKFEISLDDDVIDMVSVNARKLLGSNYITSGKKMLDALEKKVCGQNIQTLTGKHNEVIFVVNKRKDMTLDRYQQTEEFGEEYKAFNFDLWASENWAREISTSEDEIRKRYQAVIMYSLAAGLVLGDKSLRGVILE